MDYAAYQAPFCGPAGAFVFFIKCFFFLSLTLLECMYTHPPSRSFLPRILF